jgi:hypothetical protein
MADRIVPLYSNIKYKYTAIKVSDEDKKVRMGKIRDLVQLYIGNKYVDEKSGQIYTVCIVTKVMEMLNVPSVIDDQSQTHEIYKVEDGKAYFHHYIFSKTMFGVHDSGWKMIELDKPLEN